MSRVKWEEGLRFQLILSQEHPPGAEGTPCVPLKDGVPMLSSDG